MAKAERVEGFDNKWRLVPDDGPTEIFVLNTTDDVTPEYLLTLLDEIRNTPPSPPVRTTNGRLTDLETGLQKLEQRIAALEPTQGLRHGNS